jgi:plastocyanin
MNNALKYARRSDDHRRPERGLDRPSSMVHTVTADPSRPGISRATAEGPSRSLGDIAPGGTFRHTFEVPGAYVYFCIPHEAAGMIGRVTVQDKQ